MKIALAQHDFAVGSIRANLELASACIAEARQRGASILLFPELALTGYPPEDLLLRPGFMRRVHEALDALSGQVTGIDILIGHPWADDGRRYNAASWISEGLVRGRYYKQCLPNYAVFDERRYFEPGDRPLVVEKNGVRFGVLICEDAWERGPAGQAADQGAQCLLILNASPYRDDKSGDRLKMLAARHAETGLPIAYCNLVGGQDELVFDGRSMLVNRDGAIAATGPLCKEKLLLTGYQPGEETFQPENWPEAPAGEDAEIYTVLVRGLADYARKNGFEDVVLGLSGGIDSALTLAIAADAFAPDRVHAVMMPSRHTSELSLQLAEQQSELLGVDYRCISIEDSFESMLATLGESMGEIPTGITVENLQARLRGNILMALSNRHGWLPLATSNKSELAVGYSTIYGDMCGGFSPIKDCLKTRVWSLSRYRNRVGPAIPEAVIRRAPTAELAPGQTDQDSLPPYETLDAILEMYVDQDCSIGEIVEAGFDEETVRKIARLVLVNEYKRRQGAPGTRITSRGFGRDRRYPITSGWREESV